MKKRSLPPCMYRKGNSFYIVKKNKWTNLGSSFPAALKAYAQYINTGTGGLDEIVDEVIAESQKKCAENTMKTYRRAAIAIKKAFVEFAPEQVKPTHAAQFLDAHKDTPSLANQYRTVLKLAFNIAVRRGLASANPVASIAPFQTGKRDRYITPGEFTAIKKHAPPALSVIMDLCYLTGQRIGDILRIKRSDLLEDGIFFIQQKTGAKLTIAWSPELRDAVDRAKKLAGKVRCFTLLASTDGKPLVYDTIHEHWTKACKAAGVDNAHIHDIRAASGTDANDAGQDSKALLGHKSESSHQRYLRSKKIPIVEPVKRKQS